MISQSLLLATIALSLTACNPSDDTSSRNGPHSTATVQIHNTAPFEMDTKLSSDLFLPNQIAILASPATIQAAAEASKIDADTISDSLEIYRIQGTDLVTISSYHHDKVTSKKIAQAIIDAYIKNRSRQEIDRATIALEALDHELQRHGDLVHDHQKSLTVLIQQYGIPYFDGRSQNPVGMTEEKMYHAAQQRLDQLKQDRDRLKIQVDQLLNTPAADLIATAAGLELPENQVTSLYNEYQTTQRELEALTTNGLGETHPNVVSLRKRADKQLAQANTAVTSIKEILKIRINLVDRQVERMEETVLNKKSDTVDLSIRQHEYTTAREEYEQSRSLHREMKMQQQEARVHHHMPRTPITIHGWTQE